MLDLAAQEIGNVLTGKKLQMLEKSLLKQIGVFEIVALFEKIPLRAVKRSGSRRDIFSAKPNIRSTNDSNFRYGHFTNSSLEIFDKIPVLEQYESSHVQEVNPSTSLNESSFEVEFETDININLDMRYSSSNQTCFTKRKIACKLYERNKHEKSFMGRSFTDDVLHYLTHVINLIYSLFSICGVHLNNQQFYNSIGLPMNIKLQQEIMKGFVAFHGYEFEKEPSDFEKSIFIDREEKILMKN